MTPVDVGGGSGHKCRGVLSLPISTVAQQPRNIYAHKRSNQQQRAQRGAQQMKSGVRHFRRVNEKEANNHPYHWESKNHLLLKKIEVNVWVERRAFSGDDKWIAKAQQQRHTDGWSKFNVITRESNKEVARTMAVEWMDAYVEKVVVCPESLNELREDGWNVIWRKSGSHTAPHHAFVRLRKGAVRQRLYMDRDEFETLER